MYLYLGYPTVDPYANGTPYAVPQYKFQALFSNTFNTATNVYLGVSSSTFPAMSTSGTQPTVYWSFYAQAITGTSTTVPAWTGMKTPTGSAYYIDGTKTSITATVVNNAIVGNQGRQLILRTTLPHNTVRFTFAASDSTNGVGFKAVSGGSYDFGFGYAFVVCADDDTIALLDEIITLLGSIDAELDTQTELLNSIIQYLNGMDQMLNDIGQNVYGIYDLLKNALAQEGEELSQDAAHLGDTILQRADSEQYWKDKNTENFEALDLENFKFDGGLISGLSVVGNLFSGIWDSLGAVSVMFTFPLILGVSLVVVGRVARSAGKGKSDKGGDDG